jgi:phosphate:Na+ symporter
LPFTWWFLLYVLGSLGLFIYGLKVMSEGIQRAAGPQMRKVLERMTGNRLAGVVTGFTITSIIQSSSASTVLTVGFVNAGLVTLSQSVGVIMGINIGTTITAWLISFLDLQLQSTRTVLPLMVLVVPMLFSRNKKWNAWGDFLMGFLLLVIGLIFMKDQLPDFTQLGDKLEFLSQLTSYGYFSLFLIVITGVIVTMLLQSSTATMALTIILCNRGWLSFDVAAAMILGANIGTTFTAEIAALIGNINAKRAARVHTMFNLFGSVWMFPLLPIVTRWIDQMSTGFLYEKTAFLDQYSIPIALSVFHSSFNIINALLFMAIPNVLLKAANKTIRHKERGENHIRTETENISMPNLLNLPELAIIQTRKRLSDVLIEMRKVYQLVQMFHQSTELHEREGLKMNINNQKESVEGLIQLLDSDLDEMTTFETSKNTAREIHTIQEISERQETLMTHLLQIVATLEAKNANQCWFDPAQRLSILQVLESQGECLKQIQSFYQDKPRENFVPGLKVIPISSMQNTDLSPDQDDTSLSTSKQKQSRFYYSTIMNFLHLNNDILLTCVNELNRSK